MREADILASTYGDMVTVYRAYKTTLPNGESVFKSKKEGNRIYENIPCALSTHTGGRLDQGKSTAKTETAYSLFVNPEVDIQANDYLLICQLGKEISAMAGFPDRHPSHNNIPVKLEPGIV